MRSALEITRGQFSSLPPKMSLQTEGWHRVVRVARKPCSLYVAPQRDLLAVHEATHRLRASGEPVLHCSHTWDGWAGHPLCGLLLLQVKQTLGLKGLFLRGPKPGSLDSHAAGHPPPRPSVSQRLLRRTASAPTKSQKPSRKGFPELALGTQDTGSEGAADDVAPPSPNPALEAPTQEKSGSSSPRGKAAAGEAMEERTPAQVRSPHVPEGPGPAGMATTCMKCVVGSCAGMDIEGLRREQPPSPGTAGSHTAISQQPRARVDSLGGPCCSLSTRATPGRKREAPKGPRARRQGPGSGSVSSDSSSPGSPGSPKVAPCQPEGAHRQQGPLQGEMNALFVQKLEEIRSHSPMFSTGKACRHSSASRVLHTAAHLACLGSPRLLCSCGSALPAPSA